MNSLRSVFSSSHSQFRVWPKGDLLETLRVKRTLFSAVQVQKIYTTLMTVENSDTFYSSCGKLSVNLLLLAHESELVLVHGGS